MKRKFFFIYLVLPLIQLAMPGCESKKPKVYRVGILCGSDAVKSAEAGFKARMTELGYVEGKNIVYDQQNVTNYDPAEYLRIAKKFVNDKVDLIFVFPTDPTVAVKAATEGTQIQVVFSIAGLEGYTLVKSVREPGGNMTGVRYPVSDLTAKGIEFLSELAPKIKRIYIAYDPKYPNSLPAIRAARATARSKGMTLVEFPAATTEEVKTDLEARSRSGNIGVEAVFVLPELLILSPAGWEVVSRFAAKHRLLLAGPSADEALHQGAVFTYGVDLFEQGRLAAPLADKILKGASPGSIPIVTPEAYLRLNVKLAHELGLNVPEGLLKQADRIIR
jgi:putative ABC transport system substrate-binding protein